VTAVGFTTVKLKNNEVEGPEFAHVSVPLYVPIANVGGSCICNGLTTLMDESVMFNAQVGGEADGQPDVVVMASKTVLRELERPKAMG
jgi:hypothetical protein